MFISTPPPATTEISIPTGVSDAAWLLLMAILGWAAQHVMRRSQAAEGKRSTARTEEEEDTSVEHQAMIVAQRALEQSEAALNEAGEARVMIADLQAQLQELVDYVHYLWTLIPASRRRDAKKPPPTVGHLPGHSGEDE